MSATAGRAEGHVVVRRLAETDLDAVAELEQTLFAASAWSRTMLAEELAGAGRWYVAIEDETAAGLLGYAGLWFDGDVVQVMTIGVAPEAQGRGLGGLLLDALVGRARELGASAVLLEVRVDNEPAIGLYRARGFEVLGRRRRYYQPEDVDAFTMRRELP